MEIKLKVWIVNSTKKKLEIVINLNTFVWNIFESYIIFIVDMEFGTHRHNRAVYGSNKIRLVQFSKTSNLIILKHHDNYLSLFTQTYRIAHQL